MRKPVAKSAQAGVTPADQDWEEKARRLIKVELARSGLGYGDLARKLAKIGIAESAAQTNRKVNRGRFSTAFLLQCMAALDVRVLRLTEATDADKVTKSPHPANSPAETIHLWGLNSRK